MRDSVFAHELQRQVAHARRMILAASREGDEFTAAVYDGRMRELEEIAARNGAPALV